MRIDSKPLIFRVLFAFVAVCALASQVRAEKSLMWLMDQYQGNLDSIRQVTSVNVPHYGDTGVAKNGYYYSTQDLQLTRTSAYAPGIPVNATYSNVGLPDSLKMPKELERWWYILPNFAPGNFQGGMLNVHILATTANHSFRQGPPPKIQIDTGKLDGQTGQLNQSSSTKPGFVDSCITAAKGDTVWLLSKTSLGTGIPAGYIGESNMACYDHNPYFDSVGTIHVLNPWPGKTVWAQVGTTWYPLYQEEGRQGWMKTTLWEDPRDPQLFRIRLANGNPAKTTGVQYMDAGGLGGNASGVPFDFTVTPGKGGEVWIEPPTTSIGKPAISLVAPPLAFTLFIKRPAWSATAVRVLWEGNDSKYTATATKYCNWFVLDFYKGAVPSKIVLTNPLGDTLYGAHGKAKAPATWATFTDWIDVATQAATGGTFAVNTDANAPVITSGEPTSAGLCDTKVLAFSTYDYVLGKDSSEALYRYAPFAEDSSGVVYLTGANKGKSTDNCQNSGGGVTKGLVKPVLNARGFPEWSGKIDCDIGKVEHGPQYWYDTLWRSSTGVISQTNASGSVQLNAFKCLQLPLKLETAGLYYSYSNGSFFPLDTATSVPAPYRPGNYAQDFHFAMHAKAAFEYVPGLKFEFNGDDDVWVFIDRKLALDLGGMHGPIAGTIDLDALNLVEGRSYQFDMFYNERHTTGSSIAIKTTMNLVPTIDVDFDTTVAGTKKVIDSWVTETTSDASKCVEEGSTTVSNRRAGNPTYTLVFPDGIELAFDSAYAANSLPGVSISDNGKHFEIDTTVLEKSGKLPMGGQYQVRIDLGTESRSVSFTNVVPAVDVRGELFDRDGDGRADSAFLRAKGAVPAFKTSYGAVLRWADRAGVTDSVVQASASLVVLPGDSTIATVFVLPPRTSCPPAGCETRSGTVTTGLLSDTIPNPIVSLADRMAPVADSAWLVYDTTGVGEDTLYIRASEGLAPWLGLLPVGDSAYALAGRTGASRMVPGTGILVGDLLKLPIDPAANPIQPGDSVRLGGRSADGLGNAPGLRSKWVPLRAEPVARSWMLDTDGNGRPDSVGIGAKGSLGSAVSARVRWKTAAGLDTVVTVATPTGIVGGLKLPAGILGDATYCADCVLELDLGGQTRVFPLLDSVAPVALDAKLRFGTAADTLVVTVSEVFRIGTAAGEGLAAVKKAGSSSVAGTLVAGTGSAGSELRIVVPSGSVVDDSLRLRGWIVGNLDKAVGVRSRFVKIDYGPQPIAVAVFDRDGDGLVDSVAYRLDRSAAGAPSPTGFGLVWGGVSISVTSPARSADGLSWGGAVGPLPLRTEAMAGDRGWLAVGADTTSFRALVSDSVAPVAVEASLVFGYAEGDPDTLRIAPSEGLVAAVAGTWARMATDSGVATGLSIASTNAVQAISATGDLEFVAASGTITDDMLWVRLGAAVADNRGNDVGSSSRWVRLKLKPSGRAYLFDADGDGRADSMRVSVRGGLSATKAVLRWKTAAGAPDSRIWTVAPSIGPFGVRAVDAAQRFDFGATSCTGCTVSFLDDQGDALVEWPLIDSVAPAALSGRYRFGAVQDTLVVAFSEAVDGASAVAPWLEWGNGVVGGVVIPSGVLDSGVGATFLLAPANGAVEGWDSVRLAAGPLAGNVVDGNGKRVGFTSPWAPIAYGSAPFQAWLLDPAGLGRGTHVRVALTRSVPKAAMAAMDSFRFTWTNAAGTGLDLRAASVSTLAWDGVSSWTGVLSEPFALGRTGCAGGCVATSLAVDGDIGASVLLDSVAPTAVRARLRYASPEVALDTLVLELSEPWAGDATANPIEAFAQSGSAADALDLLPIQSWTLGAGTTLSLVVADRLAGDLHQGDSARLAWLPAGSHVRDEAGNRVGLLSRWVPIEFGLRPPLLTLGPYRTKLVNSNTVAGASGWDVPTSYPQIELLERRSDGSFVKLDNSGGGALGGAPVNELDHCLGIDIRINRPLKGVMIVYDNIGTAVASQDLGVLKSLWDGRPDDEKTIRIQWNATGSGHRLVASGVYLVRVVARFEDKEAGQDLRNMIWKLGFQRDTK